MESMSDLNEITMFVCTNCARPGKEMTSSGRLRPVVPDFGLPGPVQQVLVPCTGRLQPEHILRAFEAGSRVVSVIACQEDNCHYAEGSRRCALRVDYIRSILKEIGLGDDRLLLSYLPGSASEDLAMAASGRLTAIGSETYEAQVAAVRTQLMNALQGLPPNPLRVLAKEEKASDLSEAATVLSEVGCDE
jgi:F420-non-reducing hydrogenase iron-sulfur subunit